MRDKLKKPQALENKGLNAIRGGYSRLKEFLTVNGLFTLGLAICFLLILLHSLNAGHYANFYPINGTFQNYNPVRRLLDGQVPYKDFQDYLGMGHLYVGAISTALFGGTYRSSLMGFSFLTLFGFAGVCYTIGRVIFRKKEIAIFATDIVIVLLLVQPIIFTNAIVGMDEIKDALDYALGVGNSARYVRGMILPLSCGLLYIGQKLLIERIAVKSEIKFVVLTGAVAGFSFTWSNDFGISCWLCLFIMTVWQLLCQRSGLKKILIYAGVEVMSSVVAVFLTVEIFTLGHFGKWLASTFGTGGYQIWYYNSGKSYYIFDLDVSFVVLLQAGLCIYYLWNMMVRKGETENTKYTVLAYVNMVSLCAMEEYHMLSGGNSREVAFAVLFVTICFELLSIIFKGNNHRRDMTLVCIAGLVLGSAWIVSAAKGEFVFKFLTEKEGIYIEQMGGNVSTLGDDLNKTNDFLNGEEFFATYASGQEVISNVYQPSGTDYIIHVLGDKQRMEYLDAFESGNFKYAATIKETYTDWEYWVQRANWFFYRNLYDNWHPVFSNTYEMYWERNTETERENYIDNGYTVDRVDVDDATVKIIVQCDKLINGIADVYIDYEVVKRDGRLAKLNVLRTLGIENTGTVYAGGGSYYESNYLRDKSNEFIPIPVINGRGEVTLTANPKRSAYLQLNEINCEKVYTVTSDYLEVSEIRDGENGSVICIPVTAKNKNAIADVTDVVYGENHYSVIHINQDDNGIYIEIPGQTGASEKNIVKLLR